ncbi:MAG TPA: response regulator [Gemmataceae bacterium]|nr:response regulator [Gemmataceae bacterium]
MIKLLIIDDSERQREAIRRAAKRAGFRDADVTEAATEQEAYDRIAAGSFQLAVVDVMLSVPPGLEEGLGVIRALAQAQPLCRIIGLTTKADTETGVRVLRAGAHDFISSLWDEINWVELLVQRLNLWRGVIEGHTPRIPGVA